MINPKLITVCILFSYLAISCNNTESISDKQTGAVKDSVRSMIESIAKDLSKNGPSASIKYFENSPAFFMASGGKLVFPNNDSATNFINDVLVKNITKITLTWGNIMIDSLSSNFANVGATYHEVLTEITGKKIEEGGYFTGIAEKTGKGWQLRNAHWSTQKIN